jgi:hypothetical protein
MREGKEKWHPRPPGAKARPSKDAQVGQPAKAFSFWSAEIHRRFALASKSGDESPHSKSSQ